jgi:hypothetical protein
MRGEEREDQERERSGKRRRRRHMPLPLQSFLNFVTFLFLSSC